MGRRVGIDQKGTSRACGGEKGHRGTDIRLGRRPDRMPLGGGSTGDVYQIAPRPCRERRPTYSGLMQPEVAERLTLELARRVATGEIYRHSRVETRTTMAIIWSNFYQIAAL